jgi:tetratricopeptide (TPR) repeat protein
MRNATTTMVDGPRTNPNTAGGRFPLSVSPPLCGGRRAVGGTPAKRGANGGVLAAVCAVALAGCQTAMSPPGPAEGSVEAANSALRADQFDAAIADADDYLRGQPRGPQAAEAWYDKGEAYQRKVAADPTERRRNLFEAHSAYLSALTIRPPRELEGFIRAGLSTVALFQDDFPTCIEQAAAATPLVDDPHVKAWLLYNTGVAEQRLSRFTDADQTFRQVVQRFPGTPLATAAEQHEGQHLFYVQLATYASPADADRATLSLRAAGSVVSRRSDSVGRTVLDLGPFSTYAAAQQQRDNLSGSFPAAVIVP